MVAHKLQILAVIFKKCSELGTHALIRNTLTFKKKEARRPQIDMIHDRLASEIVEGNMKCTECNKKLIKLSTNVWVIVKNT